jgi:RecB family endonuclease NucS
MSSANSVDAGILQRLLGFDSQELEALIKLGVIEKQRSGKFELLPCVRRYVSHLQKVNKGQVDQAFVARHLDMSERNLRDVLRGLGIDWPVDSIDSVRVAYIRDLREKAAGRGGDGKGS